MPEFLSLTPLKERERAQALTSVSVVFGLLELGLGMSFPIIFVFFAPPE